MKRYYLSICLLTIYLSGYSQLYTGSVIRVIDGDTFAFQTEDGSLIIRMYGTDAPERDQPYSKESADFLMQYLNKEATLKTSGVDRYGRTLGVLYINNQDINLLSTKNGCSWHYKQYSKDILYAQAEAYAKKNKLGLWALQNPIPPWNWRQNK